MVPVPDLPLVMSGTAVTPPALLLVMAVTPGPSRRNQVSMVNAFVLSPAAGPKLT